MLKIKDSIDLKELEKFGFYPTMEKVGDGDFYIKNYSKTISIISDIGWGKITHRHIEVNPKTRILTFHSLTSFNYNRPSWIQDLIKSGLVEKV